MKKVVTGFGISSRDVEILKGLMSEWCEVRAVYDAEFFPDREPEVYDDFHTLAVSLMSDIREMKKVVKEHREYSDDDNKLPFE